MKTIFIVFFKKFLKPKHISSTLEDRKSFNLSTIEGNGNGLEMKTENVEITLKTTWVDETVRKMMLILIQIIFSVKCTMCIGYQV